MASTIDPKTGLPITNQAIPTSALSTPQTPIVPVTPQYDVNGITTGANQSSAYITSTLQNTQNEEQAKADLAKTNLANETSSMATLASQLNGQGTGLRSSTIDQANQITGATDKLNMLNRINAESQGLLFRRDVIPMETAKAYEGSSGVQSGMESVNRDVLQRNAIQLANNAKLAAIASADYNAAQNESNKLVNLKYDGVIAEINAKKANIENIRGNLTEAQKKVADAQTRLLDKQKQDELDKKAAETAVNNMLIEASPVAPPDVMARATKIKNEGGSAVQVAQALGKYGGDFLKNELLKEQIKTQVSNRTTDELQRKKLQAEINSINTKTSNLTPQPTGKVTAPNGDAIGLPNETLSAIGRLKLNEGQANAVAFTSRMIQSNQALDKQLGTINPKGGFYETTGYDPTSAGSAIGRFTGSDQSRVYITNSSDFIRAKLRKESGATISPEEMSADAAIYTPSGAGLDEKDLLLAKTKRDEAIKSMIAQAGPAAPYLQQYYEQAKTQGETFTSENPQLNDWYKNTTNAVNTSTAQATTGAASYGFVDNITK